MGLGDLIGKLWARLKRACSLEQKGVTPPFDWVDHHPRTRVPSQMAVVNDNCTGCEACLVIQPRYDPRTGKVIMADDASAAWYPMIGCLEQVARRSEDGHDHYQGSKIVVNFDTCIGCKACEKICSGQKIGQHEAVIWDAIHVVKGGELDAQAAHGEHDTTPYYFTGALTIYQDGQTIDSILYEHPGFGTGTKRELVRREGDALLRYALKADGAVDEQSKTPLILHEPIKELFAGENLDEVRKRYPAYTIDVEYKLPPIP